MTVLLITSPYGKFSSPMNRLPVDNKLAMFYVNPTERACSYSGLLSIIRLTKYKTKFHSKVNVIIALLRHVGLTPSYSLTCMNSWLNWASIFQQLHSLHILQTWRIDLRSALPFSIISKMNDFFEQKFSFMIVTTSGNGTLSNQSFPFLSIYG